MQEILYVNEQEQREWSEDDMDWSLKFKMKSNWNNACK